MSSQKWMPMLALLMAALGAAAAVAQTDSASERELAPGEVHDFARGTGVIKKIEADGRHVIMAHDAIPEMTWPRSSERRMAVADKRLLNNVVTGQRVQFTLDHSGLIRSLTPLR